MKRSIVLLVAALFVSLLPMATPASAAQKAGQDPVFRKQLAQLKDFQTYSALVHTRRSVSDPDRYLKGLGFQVLDGFETVDVYHVSGPAGLFRSLRGDGSISYIEANRQLDYFGETAGWATRARVAGEAAMGGPYEDASGAVIDGSGVGVVVVDSGIFGAHPDLTDRVAGNWKVVCSTPALISTATEMCFGPHEMVAAPVTDTTSGHGTHVAGIVAGDGTQSNGYFRGVATGAQLYGIGTGEGISVLYAVEAFNFIITNYADTSIFPTQVKVVNNSWGDNGVAYSPDAALSKMTKQMVDLGITVVYAAGNSAGNGSVDETSSTCDDPTPGVICVANYDDLDMGSRSNTLDVQSSRGLASQPLTYPDVSAPGASIASTCMQNEPLCNTAFGVPTVAYAPWYSLLSGTSMASPHVSGVVALLLQTNPSLTPAEVEDALLDTAFKYPGSYQADPQNPAELDDPGTPEDESVPQGTTSFDKGAGLVDVAALFDSLEVTKTGTPTPGDVQAIAVDPEDDYITAGAADIVSLTVKEEVDGLTYLVGLKNTTLPPNAGVTYSLNQNVDGKNFTTRVLLDAAGARPVIQAGTAQAVSASLDTASSTLSFFVPFGNLGNPSVNSPGHNAYIEAQIPTVVTPPAPGAGSATVFGVRVDVAPGGVGPGAVRPRELAEPRPEYGIPFTISRAVVPQQIVE